MAAWEQPLQSGQLVHCGGGYEAREAAASVATLAQPALEVWDGALREELWRALVLQLPVSVHEVAMTPLCWYFLCWPSRWWVAFGL